MSESDKQVNDRYPAKTASYQGATPNSTAKTTTNSRRLSVRKDALGNVI